MTALHKIQAAEACLNELFIEREDPIRGILLGMLTRNHVFLGGPPGTAKTTIVKTLFQWITGGKLVTATFHPAITIEDIFGPISIKGMTERDEYVRRCDNPPLFPVADCFLGDEVWKLNPACLHSFLNPLSQEREWNNPDAQKIPLRSFIGTSNELPQEDCGLEALWSRFALRYWVEDVREKSSLKKILFGGVQTKDNIGAFPKLTIRDFEDAEDEIREVDFTSTAQDAFFEIWDNFRIKEIDIDTRRFTGAVADTKITGEKMASLVKAQAWMSGRDAVKPEDLSILTHVSWTHPKQLVEIRQIIDGIAIAEAARLLKERDRIVDQITAISQKKKIDEKTFDIVAKNVLDLGRACRDFRSDEEMEMERVKSGFKALNRIFKDISAKFEAQKRNIGL